MARPGSDSLPAALRSEQTPGGLPSPQATSSEGKGSCPHCVRLRRMVERLQRSIAGLQRQIAALRALVERARRAGKRQAAPFSKGPPKADPKRPGRKWGPAHGPASWRGVPPRVDQTLDAPLPPRCPDCAGAVEEEGVEVQYQREVPEVKPLYRCFKVHVGRCRRCGRRVQGHHPLQTSSALGAARSQLGPRALALAAHLNKALGLSYGKLRALFVEVFGVVVSRGGRTLALQRVAVKAEATYEALRLEIRNSPVVYPDETSGRLNGVTIWHWVFTTPETTIYALRASRGFDVVAEVLGAEYAGTVGHDGWAPYDGLEAATHQQCLQHLLTRAKELLETARGGAVRFPRAVQELLRRALRLRDRRDAGELWERGLAIARGLLERRLDRLLRMRLTDEANRRFRNHLRKHRDALFTFLRLRGVEATNWRAEQAIRPAVIFRKVSGGHRSPRGTHTQEVLTSILRTCVQRGADALVVLDRIVRAPVPRPVEIVPAGRAP